LDSNLRTFSISLYEHGYNKFPIFPLCILLKKFQRVSWEFYFKGLSKLTTSLACRLLEIAFKTLIHDQVLLHHVVIKPIHKNANFIWFYPSTCDHLSHSQKCKLDLVLPKVYMWSSNPFTKMQNLIKFYQWWGKKTYMLIKIVAIFPFLLVVEICHKKTPILSSLNYCCHTVFCHNGINYSFILEE